MEQPERVGNGILRASRDDIRLDEGAIRATVSFASANHFFGGWHANIGIDRLFGFLGLDRVRWSKGRCASGIGKLDEGIRRVRC
jgi:hypothetical protein